MVTCSTPGLVTLNANARLYRRNTVSVARGVATVKPDEPFVVKICNFCRDAAIVRKNAVLAFAEPYQGSLLFVGGRQDSFGSEPASASLEAPPMGEDTNATDPVDAVDLDKAPADIRRQIREMLRKHGAMWSGALGAIRATEHAIVTPTDAASIRAQPYRTGAFKRQVIVHHINKMLEMEVV